MIVKCALRRARIRCACWRNVLGRVSPPIGKALDVRALDRQQRAVGVLDAEGEAVVIAECELVDVALEVLLAAALIYALHAALEDAEEALDGVGRQVTADILAGSVIDRLMGRILGPDAGVENAFVGVRPALTYSPQ